MFVDKFLDKETITIKSGDGGDGAVSFMRYKGVANGGPDGGDGGKGGDIYFVADRHRSSLIDFMYKRKYVAENGGKGGTNKCHGKDGEDEAKYLADDLAAELNAEVVCTIGHKIVLYRRSLKDGVKHIEF